MSPNIPFFFTPYFLSKIHFLSKELNSQIMGTNTTRLAFPAPLPPLTLAVSGVPNALHGDKIRNGPHVGTVAT